MLDGMRMRALQNLLKAIEEFQETASPETAAEGEPIGEEMGEKMSGDTDDSSEPPKAGVMIAVSGKPKDKMKGC